MKKLKLLVLILPMVLILAACGGTVGTTAANISRSDDRDSNLFGLWRWESYTIWRYIFNEDGTGERGVNGVQIENFTWNTSGDVLRIDLTGELIMENQLRNERWMYTISGNTLVLSSLQDEAFVFTYIRD